MPWRPCTGSARLWRDCHPADGPDGGLFRPPGHPGCPDQRTAAPAACGPGGSLCRRHQWLRGDAWYLQLPWYTPAHALAAFPMCLSPAPWLGTYGLSYMIWLIAALGAFGRPIVWLAFLLLPACSFLLPEVRSPIIAFCWCKRNRMEPSNDCSRASRERKSIWSSCRSTLIRGRRRLPCPSNRDQAIWLARCRVPSFSERWATTTTAFPTWRPCWPRTVKRYWAASETASGAADRRRRCRQRAARLCSGQGVLGVAVCYDLDAPAIAGLLVRNGATVFVLPTTSTPCRGPAFSTSTTSCWCGCEPWKTTAGFSAPLLRAGLRSSTLAVCPRKRVWRLERPGSSFCRLVTGARRRWEASCRFLAL